jgi:adenylate cyclase, class 2
VVEYPLGKGRVEGPIPSSGSMNNKEIECRFLEIDKEALVKKLIDLGAEDRGEVMLEEKIIYDKEGNWKAENKRIRLRRVGGEVKLSYKHHEAHTVDGTTEIEFGVDDFEKPELLLEQLGLKVSRYQQKKRHTLILDEVTFDIDTWPRIPTYVELEGGSEEELKNAAAAVGFDWNGVEFHDPAWVIENKYNIPVRSMTYFTFDKFE